MLRWNERGTRETQRIVSEIAANIAAAPSIDDALYSVAVAARRALGADRATCYVVAENGRICDLHTTEEDPRRRAFLERAIGVDPADVPIWRSQLAGSDPLVAVGDVFRADGISPKLAASLGYGAFIGIRLEHRSVRVDGRPAVLGTLFCSYAKRRRFRQSERDTARLIGVLATLALANGRLHADTLRLLESAEAQATENRRQALHDSLTGLPNRVQFLDRVSEILGGRPTPEPFALMILDLDHFKEVNDTLGHHSGDVLLVEAASRLRGALRGGDLVARLGGDEFAVVLPGVRTAEAATRVARQMRAALVQPVYLQDVMLEVEGSFGIALYPDHGREADVLMQRADVAMYVAKAAHTGCETYSPEHDHYTPARLSLVAELRRAIDNDELVLHYQPKVDLESRLVTGVEALVRWQHPERGLLPPVEFIPLAERTALIRPLTLHVLDRALEQCSSWRGDGLDLTVAVNLAARHLADITFPDSVRELLDRWQLPGASLELEITESTLTTHPERALEVLGRLGEMGVSIAIDDFGVGYSSLNYLKQLPADVLKIDKSFVLGMNGNEQDAMIVQSTIDLGRNLGLRVVAEGIEDEAAWERLREMGCDIAQGFYVSRPVAAIDLADWIAGFGAANASATPPFPFAREPRRALPPPGVRAPQTSGV